MVRFSSVSIAYMERYTQRSRKQVLAKIERIEDRTEVTMVAFVSSCGRKRIIEDSPWFRALPFLCFFFVPGVFVSVWGALLSSFSQK